MFIMYARPIDVGCSNNCGGSSSSLRIDHLSLFFFLSFLLHLVHLLLLLPKHLIIIMQTFTFLAKLIVYVSLLYNFVGTLCTATQTEVLVEEVRREQSSTAE